MKHFLDAQPSTRFSLPTSEQLGHRSCIHLFTSQTLMECLLCARPNSGNTAVNRKDMSLLFLSLHCGQGKMDSRQEHSLEGKKAEQRAAMVVGVVCFGTGGWGRPVEVVPLEVRHEQQEGPTHTEICREDSGRGSSKCNNRGDTILQTGWLLTHKRGVSLESVIYSIRWNLPCPVWCHSCICGCGCISQD